MAAEDANIQLNSEFTYQQYAPPLVPQITNISGTAPSGTVTRIDGNSGAGASGPTVSFSGGATGLGFTAVGTSVTLTVTNATTARTALSAAKSGANGDITTFTALTGSTGWSAWTGTGDKTTHDTATATLVQVASALKSLLDTLLASGVILP